MDDDTLTTTLCTWLDEGGVGAYRPTGGAVDPDQALIFYGPLGEQPDLALGVTVYGTVDDVALGTATRYVQVRYRGAVGDPRGANRLAAQGFTTLHGEHHRDRIARVRRVSSAQLGPDENGRQERTDNYEVILSPIPVPAPDTGGTP